MAAVTDELTRFVRQALAQGCSRTEIAGALRDAGWGSEAIAKALAAYAEADFPVPVPRPQASLSAREAFLYLLLFTTLAITAFNVGSILFELIDAMLPDPLTAARDDWRGQRVRWNVSSVLIAFPTFLLVGWVLRRTLSRDRTKRASAVRRWLTYLSLFVTAAILIGDLITLVNAVLSGGLSLRFVLKVLVVAVLAGSIFAYYLLDLQQDERDA